MTSKNFNWILYSIAATIVVTIAVQFYWNYKNYQTNKQRVTNDIQISLDNALEEYYAEIAKSDFLTIIKSDSVSSAWRNNPSDTLKFSQITIETTTEDHTDSLLSSIKQKLNKQLISEHKRPVDSIIGYTQLTSSTTGFDVKQGKSIKEVHVLKGKKAFDSLKILQKKLGTILISMNRDTLEYAKVDSLLTLQFKQKDITTPYALIHYKGDSLYHDSNPDLNSKPLLAATSKSTYLKPTERIILQFTDPFRDAIKLSVSGILISLMLSAAIISCLFYLLKIINQQKQLAEVKNDLISNITHEFKTPIATISVALESIKNFNAIESKAKTITYLDMSSDQLTKLNVMVEKLLETSTLDSENLELKKDTTNISELIYQLIDKHNMQMDERKIQFLSTPKAIETEVDGFHFENAINNILDNAIKYGGEDISVSIVENTSQIIISVSDTGTSLKKNQQRQNFRKILSCAQRQYP